VLFRRIAEIFAALIASLGGSVAFAGFLVWDLDEAGRLLFWLGAVWIIGGMIIGREARSKACLACAERVNYKALKCKHCGSALPTSAQPSQADFEQVKVEPRRRVTDRI
jgi:hypothetical protein